MILEQTPELMLLGYIGVFIGVVLAFEGLRQFLSRSEHAYEARNRRMRMLSKGQSPDEVLNLLLAEANRGGILAFVSRSLRQAGINIGLWGLLLIILVVGAAAFITASQFIDRQLAAPLAAVLAFLLPLIFISGLRQQRLERLTKQLPEALDLMARGLKVGHPLNVTIGNVASEMPDPVGTEFGIVQDQVSYGDTIVDAFADLAERIDTEDVRYLSVSVGIQHGTGGNLARVLQVLSKVIRDRLTMRKKIKAISAEGRFSAFILSVLPFGIFAMIMSTSPDFYDDVKDDPIFVPIMIAILTLVLLQAIILYRMVKFDF